MKNIYEKLPEDIYKKLAEELYDGVYFTDKNRKVVFWNKQAENITGYKKKEVIGTHCFDNMFNVFSTNFLGSIPTLSYTHEQT